MKQCKIIYEIHSDPFDGEYPVLHVFPDNDVLTNHEVSAQCPCKPTALDSFEESDDGEITEIVVFTHRFVS
jgi:hypothetical protein